MATQVQRVMAQMYDVCEMYRDRFGKTVFKARPRTNIPYTIARSVVRMLNLDKSKPYGTFFKPVKNGTDPIIRKLKEKTLNNKNREQIQK